MKESKNCKYCGESFSKIDFPSTFHRRITCGSTECIGNRRRELLMKLLLVKEKISLCGQGV